MSVTMKLLFLASFTTYVATMSSVQDPCAGCDEGAAYKYQKCASVHGNPCAERNSKDLVSEEEGTKKDVGCCMAKEKHDMCLKCATKDCSFETCTVNKKYYNERTIAPSNEGFSEKAMKAAGWGF